MRVQDIKSGSVDIGAIELFISPETSSALGRSILEPGDVLVSIAGTIGRTGIVPADAPELNCNQAVALIRTGDGISPAYLQAWLGTMPAERQMRGANVTGTISNLSLTSIRNLLLPVPSAAEQLAFEERLNQFQGEQARAESSAAAMEDLFASIQQRVFRGEL